MAAGSLVSDRDDTGVGLAGGLSGVCWGAILAGASGAAALSLILLVLGTGLGLSSVSPWAGQGIATGTLGGAAIVWICFTQLAAAGMGGYLAGRLRQRWLATHADEVFFRDTAHGFLAWAIATLVTAALLTSAIGSIVGTGVKGAGAAAAMAGGAAAATAPVQNGDVPALGQRYFSDSLFRRDAAAAATASPVDVETSTAEAGRIFAAAMSAGSLPPGDAQYLGQVVAQRTGLPQADSDKRVAETFARLQEKAKQLEANARDAADKARKAASLTALWLFVSLLIGAFCASLAATYGGRSRDYF